MAEEKKKTGFSFGFSKKAEPKRVVAALVQKKEEQREVITGLDGGELQVEAPKAGAPGGPLVIPCKNPLQGMGAAKKNKTTAPKANGAQAASLADQAEQGGLIARNISQLSAEDAEATRELLKDAEAEGNGGGLADGLPAAEVAPILARKGSKRARDEAPPAPTKEMFEKVAVDSFGEAMLRGMGYDPKKHTTKFVYRDKQRDGYLGLGAKPMMPGEAASIAKKKKAEAGESANAPSQAAEAKETQQTAEEMWVEKLLIVRIVSKREEFQQCFGAEAVVVAVDKDSRTCQVKARVGGKSQVFSGLGEQELQTRVSRDCKEVRVVKGQHRGQLVKLQKRDAERNIAVVQLDGNDCELSLDAVCQCMGAPK